MLLEKYRQRPDARTEYFDEYQGRIEIMRAVALYKLGKKEEAAAAYDRFQKTNYAETPAGRINANDYLTVAERYHEASYNYRFLDKALSDWGMELSLENIQLFMLPKYKANEMAGRFDSARVEGKHILSVLDSAITGQKINAIAELATIYDMQGKEAEIAQKEMDLAKHRMWATAVAFCLLTTFFVVFTLHKRRTTHRLQEAHGRLEDAHDKLKVAYDQLEETTQIKKRIQSE